MIAKAKVDALTHELVDYLMGETDNIPKEPQARRFEHEKDIKGRGAIHD